MLIAISYKTKQFLHVLIKIGLVVAAFYFIYTKLFHNSKLLFDKFLQSLRVFSAISIYSFFSLVLLSLSNWIFDILKWQTSVNHISIISINEAKTQTLSSLTASLLTPNRVGDYGAKAMYYQNYLRKKIVLLNLVGNSLQMAITTIFGIFGLLYIVQRLQPHINYNNILISLGATGISFGILIWILKMNWFTKQKRPFYKLLTSIKKIPKKAFYKTVLYSLARYIIFSFPFYYLLRLFGIEVSYLDAMTFFTSMYLLSSIMPSIFIFDVMIKGGIIIYLFGLIEVSEAIILSTVTLMWILNVVLPILMNSYHVLTFKLPQTIS